MSHSNQPPGLPTVVDEAGDTPNWVPLVGLALATVIALLVALNQALGLGAEPPAGSATGADGGVAAEAAPAKGAAEPAE